MKIQNKKHMVTCLLYTGSFKPNHATDLLHEMVDKETPRAFTAVGVLITHFKTTKTKNKKTKGNCELSINRTQDSDQAILD